MIRANVKLSWNGSYQEFSYCLTGPKGAFVQVSGYMDDDTPITLGVGSTECAPEGAVVTATDQFLSATDTQITLGAELWNMWEESPAREAFTDSTLALYYLDYGNGNRSVPFDRWRPELEAEGFSVLGIEELGDEGNYVCITSQDGYWALAQADEVDGFSLKFLGGNGETGLCEDWTNAYTTGLLQS